MDVDRGNSGGVVRVKGDSTDSRGSDSGDSERDV